MAGNSTGAQNPTRDLFGVALLAGGLAVGAGMFGWPLGTFIGFGVAGAALVGAFVSYAIRASQAGDKPEPSEPAFNTHTKALLTLGGVVAGVGGLLRLFGNPQSEGGRVAARLTGEPPPTEAVVYAASEPVLTLGGLLLAVGVVVWVVRLLSR